jgi:hypothetical protein
MPLKLLQLLLPPVQQLLWLQAMMAAAVQRQRCWFYTPCAGACLQARCHCGVCCCLGWSTDRETAGQEPAGRVNDKCVLNTNTLPIVLGIHA